MTSHRALLCVAVLALAGCSGADDTAIAVEGAAIESPGSTTSLARADSGDSTTSVPTTTVSESPTPTKPLTTAPPSALLTEVQAAYDQAQADMLEAFLRRDENYPPLADHIGDPELSTVRDVIRGAIVDGIQPTRNGQPRWSRVEELIVISDTGVHLNVCRHDALAAVNQAGETTKSGDLHARYLETMVESEGVWRWVARELIEPVADASDCASQ